MLLKRGEPIPRQLLQVIMDAGFLGDNLARLVAVRESLRLTPYLDLRIFVPTAFKPLVECTTDLREFIDNGRLVVFTFDEISTTLNKEQPGVQFSKRQHSPGRMSLVDDGLLTIADTFDRINGRSVNKDYVTIDSGLEPCPSLGSARVVALTSEATSVVRSMRTEETAKLASWLLARGHEVTLLGSAKDGPTLPCTNDMRGRTTLLETHAVLAMCDFVVGVDNGLLHLAGTIAHGPQIIAGYTSIDSRYRQIQRPEANFQIMSIDFELDDERHCQSQNNFLYEHDFRECLYGDNAVANSITAEFFIDRCERAGL